MVPREGATKIREGAAGPRGSCPNSMWAVIGSFVLL